MTAAASQYATFLVGDHYLGIDVLNVQEVLQAQRITPVPLAAPVVAGLINLRGQIVPELEMRNLLQLPPRGPDGSRYSVVVRTEHGAVSLCVDQIDDVVELDASSFDAAPRNVEPLVRDLLLGVQKLQHRLLLILDIGRTVRVSGE
jgi:purine-binding chemotaxis protein CheW